jgi:DNA cross-link repair 1A protein
MFDFHGDHYGNLPRGYQGPASIHCTPIIARLLREIHEVSPQFVVEHKYGETWEYKSEKVANGTENSKKAKVASRAQITFYNAHHCPCAAIILIELPEIGKVHLHTGDMRYHDQMLQYPRLKQAATDRRLDTIWLDTTYALATRNFSFLLSQKRLKQRLGKLKLRFKRR